MLCLICYRQCASCQVLCSGLAVNALYLLPCHALYHRVAVVLGAANVSLGTFLIQGPYAVWITWHVLLGVFVVTVVIMEVRHQRAMRQSERVRMAEAAEGSSEHEAKQVEASWAPGGQEKGGFEVHTM